MKRFVTLIIASMIIFLSPSITKADFLDLWIFGGMATPNDDISTVYTEDWLDAMFDSPGDFLLEGSDYGWTIGINPRFELDDISLSYLDFPTANSRIIDPETGKAQSFFDTKTTVIPIKVGVDYYLLDKVMGLYVKADLQYNYLSHTIEDISDIFDELGSLQNQTVGRFGAGVGAGFEFDFPLVGLGLEVNYNWLNLIGKDDDELDKSYIGFSLMVGL